MANVPNAEYGAPARNLPFLKNDPLQENVQNSVPKGFITTQIHVLCADFVKFGRQEVGEIARCLRHKKNTKFRQAFSLSLLHGSRPT